MPIGFDSGDFGGGRTDWRPAPAPDPREVLDPWRDEPAPPVETGFWTWVEVEQLILTPVVWTRWRTRADERVCPECGPLNGLAWPAGQGPAPPLHVNCRCERAYAFTEWQARPGTTWELRWV